MIRLITVDGKMLPTVLQDDIKYDPQLLLNQYCRSCFLRRKQYLGSVSDREPFDLQRAAIIRDIMIFKGIGDPIAYALGNQLRLDWQKFKCIDQNMFLCE